MLVFIKTATNTYRSCAISFYLKLIRFNICLYVQDKSSSFFKCILVSQYILLDVSHIIWEILQSWTIHKLPCFRYSISLSKFNLSSSLLSQLILLYFRECPWNFFIRQYSSFLNRWISSIPNKKSALCVIKLMLFSISSSVNSFCIVKISSTYYDTQRSHNPESYFDINLFRNFG